MATYLNYDDQGFIVGTKRLESGIKSIGEDTQEIIQILKSQNQINQTVLNRIAKSNERIANKKSMRIRGVVPTYDPTSLGRNDASQPSMQGQAQSKQRHRQKLSSTSQQPKKRQGVLAGRVATRLVMSPQALKSNQAQHWPIEPTIKTIVAQAVPIGQGLVEVEPRAQKRQITPLAAYLVQLVQLARQTILLAKMGVRRSKKTAIVTS